jgi:hypothetical protein
MAPPDLSCEGVGRGDGGGLKSVEGTSKFSRKNFGYLETYRSGILRSSSKPQNVRERDPRPLASAGRRPSAQHTAISRMHFSNSYPNLVKFFGRDAQIIVHPLLHVRIRS